MKSKRITPVFIFLLWNLAFVTLAFRSYSQGDMAQASISHDNCILKLPKACLLQAINDTVLPTLSNSGKGLVQYEIISLQKDRNPYRSVMHDCKNPMVVLDDIYTEEELKTLQEQKRLMQEQFIFEWQQQVRKDRMDIGLGEIIQGFYLKPPF